ncbi:MAG: hypothetical protein A2X48_22885 [Lentisphaerae bacterium GWF2_49_21]|nr:MAG: hypothetical protein A2X48_22885 [Lentisphaerae bacterium GWF2_49_21]
MAVSNIVSAEQNSTRKQDASPDSYFGKLKQEFKEIGEAYFIGGLSEDEILGGIETGGGMEKFFESTEKVSKEIIPAEGMPFTKACKFTISTKPKVFWDVSFQLLNREPVKKGEAILVVFWARGKKVPQIVDDGAGATFQSYIQSSIGKFPKGRVNNFYDCKMLSDKWERYYIKTTPLAMDFPAGKLALIGMMGHKEQTVEVGGIAWMAFPEGANLAKMPKQSWNYEGRAADAPWRKEAAERIGKIRKGNMSIEVVDEKGQAVNDADVKIRMKQHEFRFGVAVSVSAFTGGKKSTPEDIAKYRETSTGFFNSIVLDNHLKWAFFEGDRKNGWKDTKECLKFYHDNGKYIRGHVLVWPTVYRTPESLRDKFKGNKDLLGETVRKHVIEEVSEFKEWISDWDVTNETSVNRDFMDTLGPESMLDWYRIAHEADPKTALTFNEPAFGADGMELGSFPEKMLSDKCRGWVDYLIQKKAPLYYIGSQCHGGSVGKEFGGKTGPEGLWKYFDHLSSYYGKKLQYTELDVGIGDPSDPDQLAYQADLLRDTMIIAFAHPAFDAITQWGFWEGSHYAPAAALWTKDWKLRPVGDAYLNLVYKDWWTDADLKSGKDGKCLANAFFGDYEITVNGRPRPVKYSALEKDKTIRIELKQ